jgi:hypothetical protein
LLQFSASRQTANANPTISLPHCIIMRDMPLIPSHSVSGRDNSGSFVVPVYIILCSLIHHCFV